MRGSFRPSSECDTITEPSSVAFLPVSVTVQAQAGREVTTEMNRTPRNATLFISISPKITLLSRSTAKGFQN
jgi:hypothetical protein